MRYQIWDTATGVFVDHILIAPDGSFLVTLPMDNDNKRVVPSLEPGRYRRRLSTERYDEHGTEIYERDILGVPAPDKSKAVVVFDASDAAFKAELVGHPGVYDHHWTLPGSDWIVRGNIDGNPELLEEQP